MPSDRELLDSLRVSYQELQKLYEKEHRLRIDAENELRSLQTKHENEIVLFEKNRKSLGTFSSIYSLGVFYRHKSQIK